MPACDIDGFCVWCGIMRIGVTVFPGSNADWDAFHVLRDVMQVPTEYVFHTNGALPSDLDALVIPGGFSYGDYLRAGAMAALSPIGADIRRFADQGGPVLGICNGFQILTELGLLPGALTRNQHLRFECRDVFVRVEGDGVFTQGLRTGQVLRLPIAHADGRYQCTPEVSEALERTRRVAFRYCTADGQLDDRYEVNPNGSVSHIAGIYNERGNVLGLMPHPERASEAVLGNTDGRVLFEQLIRHLEASKSS
jgi:phosphoribosylformylglycinamidine synthase I